MSATTILNKHHPYYNNSNQKSFNYFLRVSSTCSNGTQPCGKKQQQLVAARFCEGGHICSLPRECCTQGCCPPYQSGPRQLPPASDHVLNLFFISHWYFWCVVVAIILAILCAYSLWKKRRTLCGWGFPDHHTQSEGDSAGSCYAPPQYSRCNSFHHPPPPYTEVTSKPDLYPLVFTCNSDNGKNGSSYLMVQYFRNYIVRPAGSLSATSTVDSLSSSFICNANEANTLVPPPYSRATSPDIGPHFQQQNQQHYTMPRSASQLVCVNGQDVLNGNLAMQQIYQPRGSQYSTTTTTFNGAAAAAAAVAFYSNSTQLRMVDNGDGHSPSSLYSGNAPICQIAAAETTDFSRPRRANGFVQSQSDQHFRYMGNSSNNTSISDIFVNNSNNNNNNSCAAELCNQSDRMEELTAHSEANGSSPHNVIGSGGGTPAIYSNGCIQTHPLVHTAGNNTQQLLLADGTNNSNSAVYNSSSSIGGISINVPGATASEEYRDLDVLRRSLETCCQFLQQQQQQQLPSAATNFVCGDSPLRMHELVKKYGEESLRSYVTSGTCSAVSSLANIGTPSSPPQATSPTGEVKEILDQIRQLQSQGPGLEDAMMLSPRPQLLHAMSTPSPTKPTHFPAVALNQLQRFPTMPERRSNMRVTSPTTSHESAVALSSEATVKQQMATTSHAVVSNNMLSKRPSTLQQTKRKFLFAPKPPNKAMYIPMIMNSSSSATAAAPLQSRCTLKSPVSSVVSANFFGYRGRVRKGWISRSAPTTPGTALPSNRLGDDSPLLNEHDEDQEADQHEDYAE